MWPNRNCAPVPGHEPFSATENRRGEKTFPRNRGTDASFSHGRAPRTCRWPAVQRSPTPNLVPGRYFYRVAGLQGSRSAAELTAATFEAMNPPREEALFWLENMVSVQTRSQIQANLAKALRY